MLYSQFLQKIRESNFTNQCDCTHMPLNLLVTHFSYKTLVVLCQIWVWVFPVDRFLHFLHKSRIISYEFGVLCFSECSSGRQRLHLLVLPTAPIHVYPSLAISAQAPCKRLLLGLAKGIIFANMAGSGSGSETDLNPGDSISQIGGRANKADSKVSKASSVKLKKGPKAKPDGPLPVCFLHKGRCTPDYTKWHGGCFCKDPCYKGVRNRMRVIKEKPDGLTEDIKFFTTDPEAWHKEVYPWAFGDGQQQKKKPTATRRHPICFPDFPFECI